jgi:hypothetical protein
MTSRKYGLLVLWIAVVFLLLALPTGAQSILTQTSFGTGFIVSSDGYILTNKHVVAGATDVTVIIGGKEYRAKVVDSLSDNDIALLKVDANGLPTVLLGDSDDVQIGDTVYAIGCPAGVCGTITAGRVANLGISSPTEEGTMLHDLIMLDITTTHGSSGGTLLNNKGEVIGITTAGVVVQGETTGFGLSIPINQAIPLLQEVPGFSTSQMGRATATLSLQQIRERCGIATSFVKSTRAIDLASFLPNTVSNLHLSRNVPLSWRCGIEDLPYQAVASAHGSSPGLDGTSVLIYALAFKNHAQAEEGSRFLMSSESIPTGSSVGPWEPGFATVCAYTEHSILVIRIEKYEQLNSIEAHYVIRSYSSHKWLSAGEFLCLPESHYGFVGDCVLVYNELLFVVRYGLSGTPTSATPTFAVPLDHTLSASGQLMVKYPDALSGGKWEFTGFYLDNFSDNLIRGLNQIMSAIGKVK